MAQINPFIHFNGNAEDAFTFYKAVFGGEFTSFICFNDLSFENFAVSQQEAEKIMHIELPIGKQSVLMGSDTPKELGQHNERETRSKIHLRAESKEDAEHLFNSLSNGGEIEFPLQEAPWGSYFGMLRDRFGIEWMVDFR
jgi:PhnB protein